MLLQVFLLLLLSFFMLYLAQLCHLYWTRHWFPHPKAVALHSAVHRLLKPRSPDDCPACRLSSTLSTGVEPAAPPVRPWREVKSRRRAPKRVNTEGFACPNQQCPYSGITESQRTRKRRSKRTGVILILEKCINSLTGTDGLRPRSHQCWSTSSPPQASSIKNCKFLSRRVNR